MMKDEFERLAGYEVSADDYYKVIEPMYMAVELNKLEFIKTLNKKRFALPTHKEMLKQLKDKAKEYEYTYPYDWWHAYEIKEELEDLGRAFAKRFYLWGNQPACEWFYLDIRRNSWTNELEKMTLCFGRANSFSEEIILFTK